MAGGWSPPWPTRRPACGACRLATGSPTSAMPSPTRCPRCGRWRHASAGRPCSICPRAGWAMGLWRVQDGRSFLVRKGADGALVRAARRVARRQPRGRGASKGREAAPRRSWPRTARTRERWPPSHRRARHGRLVAGWPLDRRPAGATGSTKGLFKIPVEGGEPVRLVSGQAFNPAWSPKGDLIVYAAAVGGNVPTSRACDRMAPRSSCHPKRVRPGGYRFLPNGTGLVYLRHTQLPDFWLLDLGHEEDSPPHPPQLSRRTCRRSTSPRTEGTWCSTARARTRTSS